MRDFDYLEPRSIAEASRMLAEHQDNCRMMAGGTALMLALRQRMVSPSCVVSLRNVRELRGITYDENAGLRIGALTLHAELARSPLARRQFPMLADMASRLANPQVRNQGTIGGNLCYADPATDPPSCLMALDADVVVSSARGNRILKVEDFVVDYYLTALEVDELVSEIRIPPSDFNAGYHARFLRTAAEHRPLVNLAVSIRKDGDACADIRMVIGAATATPARLRKTEQFLKGKSVTARIATEAADLAITEVAPISDIRGTAEFRREMIRVVSRRTIEGLFDPAAPAAKSVA
jgi:aerobic carbon-monoxide dehydrogenase medium subunit